MKKYFKFSYITAGFLFFINPTFGLIDIMPDFIGCILVFIGLRGLAELDEDLYMATKHLGKLGILSASRLLFAMLFSSFNSSTIMLFTFSFAIIEFILIFIFINSFYIGMEGVFNRNEGVKGLLKIENMRFLTSIFFGFKIILGFLPELCAILEVKAKIDIQNAELFMDIISYKPYMLLVEGVIVLIFGLYWFTEILKFVRIIKKDEVFVKSLNQKFVTEVINDEEGQKYAAIWYGLIFICAGFVFYIDFLLNQFRILPDAFGSLIIMAGILLLKRLIPLKNIAPYAIITSIIQGVFHYYIKNYVNFDVFAADEMEIKNAVIAAAACVVYSIASMVFLSRIFISVSTTAEYVGYTKKRSLPKKMLLLYGIYLCILTISVVIPLTQDHFSALKTLITIIFMLVTIWHLIKIKEDYETARLYVQRR